MFVHVYKAFSFKPGSRKLILSAVSVLYKPSGRKWTTSMSPSAVNYGRSWERAILRRTEEISQSFPLKTLTLRSLLYSEVTPPGGRSPQTGCRENQHCHTRQPSFLLPSLLILTSVLQKPHWQCYLLNSRSHNPLTVPVKTPQPPFFHKSCQKYNRKYNTA